VQEVTVSASCKIEEQRDLRGIQGRLCSGAEEAIIVIKPMSRPEPPMPEIALPAMNMCEDCARAHTREPSSKITRPLMNGI
jgi:hypothetical protein